MIVDIVVGVVVLVSALISFMRGFIREVLTIAGVVGGLLAAIFLGPPLVPTVREWFGVSEDKDPGKLLGIIPMEFVADALTYGVIFVAVVVSLYIITHFISGAAKAIGLGPVDRTLGVIFGIARALILLGLVYMPLNVLIPPGQKEKLFENSQTHFIVEQTAEAMAGFLPEYDDVRTEAEDSFRRQLKESDILSGGRRPASQEPPQPEQPEEEGYQEEQREELDRLFEDPALNE